MADTDWARIAIEAAGWAASSMAGLVVGAWRGGRRSAIHDQKVKEDYDSKITAAERRGEVKVQTEIAAFRDTVIALRQKINDVELATERGFVAKPDFDDFRKEYREDRNRMFEKLDEIMQGQQ